MKIQGFDYVTQAPIELTRAEWQERIAEAIKAGGFRRVACGETLVHACGGRMLAEIYQNVSAPLQAQAASDTVLAQENGSTA